MFFTPASSSEMGVSVNDGKRMQSSWAIRLGQLALFLFVATSAVLASDEAVRTPAGRRVMEMIGFINGTNADNFEDYITTQFTPAFKEQFPMSMHTGVIQRIREEHGQVELVDATQSSPDRIQAVLKSKEKPLWLNLTIQVESDSPHRIVLMGMRPAAPPEEGAQEASPADIEELDGYLARKMENREFSGTVLIAKDGDPVFHKAYGLASKRFGVTNELDTRYNLASIGKLFTTIAITQLMQQGKLILDDPIGKHLDMFPPEVAQKVTIRHLFNEQSGWGDYWGHEYYLAHKNELRTVEDYMEFIKDIPLDFEPGTSRQHCNTGFIVAGAIIEAVSGLDYDSYLEQNIFRPAGMLNTACYHRDGPVAKLAMGYTNLNPNDATREGYQWDTGYMWPPKGTPCGGGHSTTEDLLKLDRALRSHQLLNANYTSYLLNRFAGSPDDPPATPGGMPAWVGGAPGASTYLGMDFQSSYSVIVLSNYDHPCGFDVARKVNEMLGL